MSNVAIRHSGSLKDFHGITDWHSVTPFSKWATSMPSDLAGLVLLLTDSGVPMEVLLRVALHVLQQRDRGVPTLHCAACPVTSMVPQCKGPEAEPAFRCTRHMCLVRVHWHVNKSYREYWRVKMTVNNFNMLKNYSDWNLVVQHPDMQNLTQVFSFNNYPLVHYGTINDTELFWGLPDFNKMLLQDGNVQTEILLRKDEDFTFDASWAFPRKIYFDGGTYMERTELRSCQIKRGFAKLDGSLQRHTDGGPSALHPFAGQAPRGAPTYRLEMNM